MHTPQMAVQAVFCPKLSARVQGRKATAASACFGRRGQARCRGRLVEDPYSFASYRDSDGSLKKS